MSAPYMPLYTGDYLRDTSHFETIQHGAYVLMLIYLWNNDGWAKNKRNVICRITGLTASEYRYKWPAVEEKFIISEGQIEHKRVTIELKKSADISASKSAAAAAREARKKEGKKPKRVKTSLKTREKVVDKMKKPKQNQGKSSTGDTIPFHRNGFPLTGKKPFLSDATLKKIEPDEMSAADEAPARMSGGGLTAETKNKVSEMLYALAPQLRKGVISTRDVLDLKRAIIGQVDGQICLRANYAISDDLATALAVSDVQIVFDTEPAGDEPKLKLVGNDDD